MRRRMYSFSFWHLFTYPNPPSCSFLPLPLCAHASH